MLEVAEECIRPISISVRSSVSKMFGDSAFHMPRVAPMGLQWGEMGENNLSHVLDCSCIFNMLLHFWGFIPKWLIIDSWWIPIL